MKKFFLTLCAISNLLWANASSYRDITVFKSGTEGYKSFRIPAIIRLTNGDLLAFSEGRVNGAGDFGNIDIVMKRSADKGKTWSKLQVVADVDKLPAHNPAPVVDLTDPAYPKGRIFLFYNTGTTHEAEILKGVGIKQSFYKTSTDGGKTWSSPIEITNQIHRPNQPLINPNYAFSEDWRYYANTPGHAMQFKTGQYKGRIYVAANHSAGPPQKKAAQYVAHGYFTDDHGKTFKLANSLNLPGSNESMAAELSGGRLMMNSRNQAGNVRARIVSVSSNGGVSWDTTYFDMNLIDPVCQGSILDIGVKKGKNILAFCNAADIKYRNNLTLRISYDEGKSWLKNIPIYSGSDVENNDYSAYSDLIKISSGKIGVLYEKDDYSLIVFRRIDWK